MSKILITDSLFIAKKHVDKLKQQGHEVVRLDKPCASEEELVESIQGVDGYIIGGVEQVTDKVIEAADKLKAIVFTGAGYKEFIPGYKLATKKGIAISNAPGGNSSSVAEYTICMMLSMTRQIFSLGSAGDKNFMTTESLSNKSVGIIGLGNVGLLVAKQLKALGVGDVAYYSPRRKYQYENGFGIHYSPIEEIFRRNDIVTLHTSKDAGEGFINKGHISLMKKGSLLVNASYPQVVDEESLLDRLKLGDISAIYDAPPNSGEFSKLPIENWYCSNSQTAFNTTDAVEVVSTMAITSIINLLNDGNDLFLVN